MWRYRFDESGGYDCCSAAYIISHGENDRIVLDTHYFPGFQPYGYSRPAEPGADPHRPMPEVEELAQFLVSSLNARDAIKEANPT